MANRQDVVRRHEDIVRTEFESVWNEGTFDEAWYTEDFRYHGVDDEPVDCNAYVGTVAGFRFAFPGVELTIDDCVCEGDRVLVRYSATVTPEREVIDFVSSGDPVDVSGVVLYRLADDQIAEGWIRLVLAGVDGDHIEDGRLAEGWISDDTLGTMDQIRTFSDPTRGRGNIEHPS